MKYKHNALFVALMFCSAAATAGRFSRVASFPTYLNQSSAQQALPHSAEIISANQDETILVYTDSLSGSLGFVDISSPAKPKSLGALKLNGEPTSVVIGGDTAFVALNTSASFAAPSGELLLVDIKSQQIRGRCKLLGQPDSIAMAKDGRYLAIAIENERDENVNAGKLPQLPAGNLAIVDLGANQAGQHATSLCQHMRLVDLTGLAEIGSADPEPEFVDFNANNEIVLTLQENNHIVIVDAKTATVQQHFSAGNVRLENVDSNTDGKINAADTLVMNREPDTVKWLDTNRFVTANEGDYQGGARGFTIFNKDGKVLFESGAAFENKIIQAGHYPEKRSSKKGNEPEGIAVGSIDGQQYIFVLSERASVIGVYKDTGDKPEFVQLLPSGIAPESAVFLPKKQALISANEKDFRQEDGVGSHLMTYQFQQGKANYPQLLSDKKDGQYIGWGALSGLTADTKKAGLLYAVNDSFYSDQPSIFKIDASQTPAKIIDAIAVTLDGKTAKNLDLEGIVQDGEGGFWLASEGNEKKGIPHAIFHANGLGQIDRTIHFPSELIASQTRFGAEGITFVGNSLWVAMQSGWQDDPKQTTKLLRYDLATHRWSAAHYPLEQTSAGWVGLSEIASNPEQTHLYVIERDNQIASKAKIKRLYKIELASLHTKALGETLPVVKKTFVHDFIADLKQTQGYVTDKIEGFTFDKSGKAYAVTDNDGVKDSAGETLFFEVNLPQQ